LKLAVLDDYQRLALKSADWDRLRKRGVEVSVFHEAFAAREDAAAKLAPFDVLVLMRERTPFPAELIGKLPNLKFISMTGLRSASLDLAACSARRVPVRGDGGVLLPADAGRGARPGEGGARHARRALA
jgi:D-3-phosphoglycerate dehydrogenase